MASSSSASSLLRTAARLARRGAPIAAAVIPLMIAGCAAESRSPLASGDEGTTGSASQADTITPPGSMPLLTYVMPNGEWSTSQEIGSGIFNQPFPFFYRGFGARRIIPVGGFSTNMLMFGFYDVTHEKQVRVKQSVNGVAQDVFGVFNDGKWFVDSNGDQMHESDDATYQFGSPGDIPVSGNWSATGLGVFNAGRWSIDANGTGGWDNGDVAYNFGQAGDIPVVGDWTGDGRSKIGVFRNGTWMLDANGDGVLQLPYPYGPDIYRSFGSPGDIPVVGPFGPGGRDAIGVFNKGQGGWYLDTTNDGGWQGGGVDTLVMGYGNGGTPLVGDWKTQTVGFGVGCTTQGCNFPVGQSLRSPLSVTLRNSASDPTSTETITYETEYLASVEYLCTDPAAPAVQCPRSFQIDAGGASAALAPSSGLSPAAHAVTVTGSSALELIDTRPPKEVGVGWSMTYPYQPGISFLNPGDGSVQLHAKAWYAAPSDDTLARWIDEANAQADILTRSQSYYQLANDYAQLAQFNVDQLNTLIDNVTLRVSAATNPIDKKKWQAILDSLTNTRDSQPTPVPATQLSQYLNDLVVASKADLLLQADRAQALLAMFDKAQAELDAITASAASEIGRLRDGRKGKVAQSTSSPASRLRSAIAAMPSG
jgi:hypothetical protein